MGINFYSDGCRIEVYFQILLKCIKEILKILYWGFYLLVMKMYNFIYINKYLFIYLLVISINICLRLKYYEEIFREVGKLNGIKYIFYFVLGKYFFQKINLGR